MTLMAGSMLKKTAHDTLPEYPSMTLWRSENLHTPLNMNGGFIHNVHSVSASFF